MKIFGSWSPSRQPWLGLLSAGPKIWIGSPGQWKHLSCNGRSFSDLSHYHQQDSSHLHCHHQDPSHLHFQQVHWWRFSLQQWRRLWHWGWSVLWQNPCCPAKARWLCYLLWHRVLYTVYHTHGAARGLTLWHCDDLMAAWRRRNPWQNVTVFGPQDTLMSHTMSHSAGTPRHTCHTFPPTWSQTLDGHLPNFYLETDILIAGKANMKVVVSNNIPFWSSTVSTHVLIYARQKICMKAVRKLNRAVQKLCKTHTCVLLHLELVGRQWWGERSEQIDALWWPPPNQQNQCPAERPFF